MSNQHDEGTARLMRDNLRKVEESLREATGQNWGCALIVWNPEQPTRANYTANTRRNETADALIQLGLRLKSDRMR